MNDNSTFENFDFGASLIASLEQAVAYQKGDKSKGRRVVHEIPTPEYKAEDVVRVREKYNLSQRGLAAAMNVSPRTVEAWEAGKNTPAGASAKLLYLLEKDETVIDELVSV